MTFVTWSHQCGIFGRNGIPGGVYASGMKLFLAFGLLLVISGAVTGGGCSKTGTGFSTDAATSSDSASATGGSGGTSNGGLGTGGASSGGVGNGGAGSGGTGSGGVVTGGTSGGGASSGGVSSGGAKAGGSGSGGSNGGGSGGKATGGMTATGGAPSGGSGQDGGVGTGGTGGPVCPGVTPWSPAYTPCRTMSDCTSPHNSCVESPPSSTVSTCGPTYCVYPAPQHQCTVDAECGSGKVCLAQATSDCCPLPSFVCAPACTATSCPADQQCGTSGKCEPTPCSAGFVCPSGTLCAPTRAGADGHGCATMLCAEGYACPSDSRCQTSASNADYHGCVPVRCTEGYTCPSDKRCQADASNADNHGCVFALCPDVACPSNHECQPSQLNSDVHGCIPKTCSTDSDCDCGACIRLGTGPKGQCAGQPYVCVVNSAGGAQAAATGGSLASGSGGAGMGGRGDAAAGGAGGGGVSGGAGGAGGGGGISTGGIVGAGGTAANGCPQTPPSNGSICNLPATFPSYGQCYYEDCTGSGRTLANCSSGTWQVTTGPCGKVVCQQDCAQGQVCLVIERGYRTVDCVTPNCGTGPLMPECVPGAMGNCSVSGSISLGANVGCNYCSGAGGCM